MAFKQSILVREDLQLPKGKLASQVAHASVEATLQSRTETVKKWRKEGMAKIVLRVSGEKELFEYARFAKEAGLVVAVITDAGRTTIAPGTTTCAGIGPAEEKDVDKITGDLKLL